MPHDLIDNQNIKLVDALKQTLPGSAAAHFAVGYFFPSGPVAEICCRLVRPQREVYPFRPPL